MVSYKCAASILFTISHSTAARGASGPSSLRGSEDSSRGLDDSIPVQVGDGEKHAVPSDKTGTLSSGLKAVLFPSPEQIGQDSWCVYLTIEQSLVFLYVLTLSICALFIQTALARRHAKILVNTMGLAMETLELIHGALENLILVKCCSCKSSSWYGNGNDLRRREYCGFACYLSHCSLCTLGWINLH